LFYRLSDVCDAQPERAGAPWFAHPSCGWRCWPWDALFAINATNCRKPRDLLLETCAADRACPDPAAQNWVRFESANSRRSPTGAGSQPVIEMMRERVPAKLVYCNVGSRFTFGV